MRSIPGNSPQYRAIIHLADQKVDFGRVIELFHGHKLKIERAKKRINDCTAPDLLDIELSVFMQRLRVQGVAGEPGLA